MSAAELAAARTERAARYQAAQRGQAAAPPATDAEAVVASSDDAVACKRERLSEDALAADPLEGIVLSGVADCPEEAREAVKAKKMCEVDCRLWESNFKPVSAGSRVFTLNRGEGSLHDKKAETDAERERNIRHLTESALRIHTARTRGERVWVHCHLGMNRGPAGLMAYCILHTEMRSLKEVFTRVKAHDKRQPKVAATSRNTFAAELVTMCIRAGKTLE